MDNMYSILIIIIFIIIIVHMNNCNYGSISKFTNVTGTGGAIFAGRDTLNEPYLEESLQPIYV